MDLRKKIKNFFTLTRKANAGFTLVELIVVIAILAILGGVAVPAYSGYVKKAERSADEALLNEINTAFASACAVNGTDQFNLPSKPTITLEGEDGAKTVASVSLFNDDFMKFFEGGEFKNTTALYYSSALGMFKNSADNLFSKVFASLTNIGESVTNLNESTFGKIGPDGLMQRVDTVTGLAAGLCEVNTNFMASLAGSLPALQASLGMEDEEFGTYLQGLIAEKQSQLNPEDPDSVYDAARYEIMANYAVLNAAQNTIGKDQSTILSNLKGGVTVQDIKNMMDKNGDAATQQEGMANAAMMYAMYTAYANGLEGDEKTEAMSIIESNDISAFVSVMANQESEQFKGFQSYLDTQRAKDDVDGYLGAMNIINQSASTNPDAVADLLVNGYGTDELSAALQDLMGSQATNP